MTFHNPASPNAAPSVNSITDPRSSLPSNATSPLSSPPSTAHHAPISQLTRPLPHPRLASALPPRGTVYVVERLGRFNRLLYPARGQALLPIVDRVVAVFSTRRADFSTPPSGIPYVLPNGRHLTVYATWSIAVVDPKHLAYSSAPVDVDRFARMLVHARLRDAIMARADSPSLDSLHPLPDLPEAVRTSVNYTANKFGLSCPLFTITSIRTTGAPVTRNRSLNLAHVPTSQNPASHEVDSVLPELPLPPEAPLANARLHPHMIHPVPPLSPLPPAHRPLHPRPHAFPHAYPPLPQLSLPPIPPAFPLPAVSHPVHHHMPPPHPYLVPHPNPRPLHITYPQPPLMTASKNRSRPRPETPVPQLHPESETRLTLDHISKPRVKPELEVARDLSLSVSQSTREIVPRTTPAVPRKPLYAPPPSPSDRGPPRPTPLPPHLLPMLVTRAFTKAALFSSPDSASSAETRVLPNGTPPTESSPTLARHLHALPPTPSAELPSSESGSENLIDDIGDTHDPTRPVLPSLDGDLSQPSDDEDDSEEAEVSYAMEDGASDAYDDVENPPLVNTTTMSPPPLVTHFSPPSTPDTGSNRPVAHDVVRGIGADVDEYDDDDDVGEEDGLGATEDEGDIDDDGRDDDQVTDDEHLPIPLSPQRQSSLELIQRKRMENARLAAWSSAHGPNAGSSSVTSTMAPTGRPEVPSIRVEDAAPEVSSQGVRSAVTRLVRAQQGRNITAVRQVVPKRMGVSVSDEDVPITHPSTQARARIPAESIVREIGSSGIPTIAVPNGAITSNLEGDTLRMMEEEQILSKTEHARRQKLMNVLEDFDKGQKSPTEGLVDVSSEDGSTDMWVDGATDSDREKFDDEALARRVAAVPKRRHKSGRRRSSSRSRRRASGDELDDGDVSTDDDYCRDCGLQRHHEHHKHSVSHRSGKTRSKLKRADSDREGADRHSDYKSSSSSRGRTKSKKSGERSARSVESRRSEHSSKDRGHRGKKGSSNGKEVRVLEREGSSSRKESSADRKRSHSKGRSGPSSSKKTTRDGEGVVERGRKEGKGKSSSRQRKGGNTGVESVGHGHGRSPPKLKPIYRHREPESTDSAPENPIPWYCEGQSAQEDTDLEDAPRRASMDSERRGRGGHALAHGGKRLYSSYGQRDKYGRRQRAQHSRTVTFLYDNI